ncbi:pentatricopeptide repeat, partial [Striga asiatica]
MGVDPVSYTYNSIMSSFVKKGYFREAWAVLDAMGEKLNLADIATYNIIIQGLWKMCRADLASAILEKLTNEGGYLDVVMYNTLINVLGSRKEAKRSEEKGKAGRVDKADELFGQMKAGGINLDVVTYNTLIEVHAKAGRVKDAYKVLRMMLDAGCAPNHVTDTILDFLESEIERLRYEKAFAALSLAKTALQLERSVAAVYAQINISVAPEYLWVSNFFLFLPETDCCASIWQDNNGDVLLASLRLILTVPFTFFIFQDLKVNFDHPKLTGERTVQNAIVEVAAMMGENVK